MLTYRSILGSTVSLINDILWLASARILVGRGGTRNRGYTCRQAAPGVDLYQVGLDHSNSLTKARSCAEINA